MNLKNPDLDLIRRTHPEFGFYGLMIRFWIFPKKRQIRFWIRKSGFGFSKKNAPSAKIEVSGRRKTNMTVKPLIANRSLPFTVK